MGKTFGDYMREQGGKQPEKEVVPTDECVLDFFADDFTFETMPQHVADIIDQIKVYDNEGKELGNPPWFKDGTPNYVLGDEAEYALCETCHISVPVDSGVVCEGCHEFFADHGRGRNNCWKNHNCGQLVTSRGQLVKEGDVLVYPSHADEFTVMKTEGTWVHGGHARGLRRRGSHEMPIIPRLMYHKETPTE